MFSRPEGHFQYTESLQTEWRWFGESVVPSYNLITWSYWALHSSSQLWSWDGNRIRADEGREGAEGSAALQNCCTSPFITLCAEYCNPHCYRQHSWCAGLDQTVRGWLLQWQSPGKSSFRDKWHRSPVTETQYHFSSGLEMRLPKSTCWTLSANDARPRVGHEKGKCGRRAACERAVICWSIRQLRRGRRKTAGGYCVGRCFTCYLSGWTIDLPLLLGFFPKLMFLSSSCCSCFCFKHRLIIHKGESTVSQVTPKKTLAVPSVRIWMSGWRKLLTFLSQPYTAAAWVTLVIQPGSSS